MWLTALPLALIPACWLWWWMSLIHPGMVIGRSAVVLLIAGSLLAAWMGARARAVPDDEPPLTIRGRVMRAAAHPSTWCVAALAWQVGVWAVCAPVHEPGSLWLVERTAAWLCAAGVASWFARGRDLPGAAWGIAGAAAVVLAMSMLCQYPDPQRPLGAVLFPVAPQSLGVLTRTGIEMPFGNANFNVGGALPLLGLSLGLWLRERQHAPSRVIHVLLVVGWLSAVVLGAGLVSGDATRAVWVTSGAMVATALALLAPRWTQAPLIILGAATLVIAQIGVTSGGIALEHPAPSTLQRVQLWRSAVEAIVDAPVLGSGVGSALAVLPTQASFPAAWLAVPSYPEHAHHEVLEAVLDGGPVLLVLLGGAALTTLWPLWRRRSEALPMAMLAAWAGVLTHALIESHLSQPGPLALLALLAGLSWAVAREGESPLPIAPRGRAFAAAGCLAVAALAAALAVGEVFDRGNPTSIQTRANARLAEFRRVGDWSGYAAEVVRLRERLGNLSDLLYLEAEARAHLRENDRAEGLALEQARLLPVHAGTLALLRRFEQRHLRRGEPEPARVVAAARSAACARAREILAEVPDSGTNHAARSALVAELANPASVTPDE